MAVDLRIVRRPAGESLSSATLNFRQKIALMFRLLMVKVDILLNYSAACVRTDD